MPASSPSLLYILSLREELAVEQRQGILIMMLKITAREKNNNTKREDSEKVKGREFKTPPPSFSRHLVAISASHRKGRPCLAGAPGSGSSSLPVLQKQQSASALH